MKRLLLFLFAALAAALLPATALADSEDNGGVVVRANGDYALPPGEELDVLVVLDGDATVAGRVHGALLVVRGDAVISGRVDGQVTIVRGDLRLANTAMVDDVRLIRSDLVRAPGATVRGDIDDSWGPFAGWGMFIGLVLLVGLGVALFVVATGFALVGGRQLTEAAASLTAKPWQTIVSGLVTVVAVPIFAVLSFATLVGFWVGLGTLLILVPALTVLGIAVSATWLGMLILHRDGERPERPVGAAALGTAILLLAFAVPGIGWFAFVVFTVWGIGGLAFLAVRGLGGRQKPQAAEPKPPVITAQPT